MSCFSSRFMPAMGSNLEEKQDMCRFVLDVNDHYGTTIVVVDVEDEAAHVLLFLEVHAGHGLVEQQDRRLGGERAAQLDALLQAVGQPPDRRLADMLDLEEVDDLLDRLAVSELLAPRRSHP